MLVMHYTGMPTAAAAMERLCDPTAAVSAHYLIDEAGQLFNFVAEEDRAWHAGVSSWRGNRNINDRSIGIELVNPGHEFGYRAFPDVQMATLIQLSQNILSRHPIPPCNVVGHSDIAPSRKQDPGELFNWAKLADHGIGNWPTQYLVNDHSLADRKNFKANLKEYGYDITDLAAATTAFQSHFRPALCRGNLDDETSKILSALLTNF